LFSVKKLLAYLFFTNNSLPSLPSFFTSARSYFFTSHSPTSFPFFALLTTLTFSTFFAFFSAITLVLNFDFNFSSAFWISTESSSLFANQTMSSSESTATYLLLATESFLSNYSPNPTTQRHTSARKAVPTAVSPFRETDASRISASA